MENKNKIILDLAGGTGAWSKPYLDAGYDVRIITLPDYDVTNWTYTDGNKQNPKIGFRKDVFDIPNMIIPIKNIYGILAAPPCTMFSIARNDKTAKKPRDLREGMRIVNACLEIVHECLYFSHRIKDDGLKFWALENPSSGYLRRFLGKEALKFHPWHYGDPYTKKTSIWGEFKEPKRSEVEPREFEHPTTKGAKDFVSCVEHFADLKDIPNGYLEKTGYSKRKTMRSITPSGFAKAFYKANK